MSSLACAHAQPHAHPDRLGCRDDPEVKSACTSCSLSAHMLGSSQPPLLAALENPTSSSSLLGLHAMLTYKETHIHTKTYTRTHTHTHTKSVIHIGSGAGCRGCSLHIAASDIAILCSQNVNRMGRLYWSGRVASLGLPGLWGQPLGTSLAYKLTLQLARALLWHRWAPLAVGQM